jgi:hypothetical protein
MGFDCVPCPDVSFNQLTFSRGSTHLMPKHAKSVLLDLVVIQIIQPVSPVKLDSTLPKKAQFAKSALPGLIHPKTRHIANFLTMLYKLIRILGIL